ncbi:MAG TPA: hypothetical protein PKX40_10840 [Spirochaetota bacterium]|nr:hypothetical protein [Spirochaetota bacterium]
MERFPISKLIVISLLLSLTTFSCSDSEHRTGMLGQTSTVIINLGLPNDHAADTSIIDKVRRFFVRDAIAQTAPAVFSSVKVRVTAADFGIIEKEFNAYGTMSLNVPSGSLRQFDVTAYVAPGDPSAATSFRGTTVANLPAGDTVTVPVSMTLNETKLVIPDMQNRRMVIMDDITGSGWLPRTQADLGFLEFFFVYDIDFDARGRIYFTNSNNPTGEGGVWMMENINDLTPQQIYTGQAYAIAVDRVRNLIYFSAGSTQSEIWVWDGTTSTQLSSGTYFQINGIDVEQSTGLLYLACNISGFYYIAKYRPGTGDIATYPDSGGLSEQVWDVVMKGGLVYATVINGSVPANNRVICLSSDLNESSLLELRRDASSNFIGPKRFIAPLNRRFYVTDDSYSTNDAVVSFSNIFDTLWILYIRDFHFYQGI